MRKLLSFLLIIITMTALGSCEQRKTETANPFFEAWDTPFGVPPFNKIKAEHYKPAVLEGIARHRAEIDSIVSEQAAPGFDNVIAALDNSGELVKTAYLVFSLVNEADGNEQTRQINMELAPVVSAHFDNIYLNDALFAKVRAVYEQKDSLGLDAQQKRLTDNIYKGFVRSGALLSAADKEKLRKINDELSVLGVRFSNNMLAEARDFALIIENKDDLAGLPESSVSAAKAEAEARGMADKWVFTLSKPSLIPFITYADERELREKLYKGYLNRCGNGDENDNNQIVNDIVRLRLEKARLMGYPSYAAFKLDDELAGTPAKVYELLDQLWTPALDLAKTELEEMKAIKKTETGDDGFESWDWWYYAEKVRKAKYDLDEETLRPYFSLENVRSGIFQLCNRLWGLSFRPVVVPTYNNECSAYEVLDKDNTHMGILYLDFFPREGKGVGAWCGAYRDACYDANGKRIAPVMTIVCNFTRPSGNTPALLSLDETATFFHEFGHALHGLFSQVRYKGIGNVELDFVELPSQIMENWAFEPEVLKMYAKHFQSGAVIPDELIEKIGNSSRFNQGFATTELLAASLSDMDIHSITEYEPIDLNRFEREVLNEKRRLIPEIAPRYRYPYFGHIFSGEGYSAGYYSYTWAEVLDKDAFEAFVETGDIFNREVAESYRKNILEKGGSEEGMSMYVKFRGHEPDAKPLMYKRGLLERETAADSTAVTQ